MRLNQITEASFPGGLTITSIERENRELELKIKFVNTVIEKYKNSINDVRNISRELDLEVNKLQDLSVEVGREKPQGFSDRYNETVATEISNHVEEINQAREEFINKFEQGIKKLNYMITSLESEIDENEDEIKRLRSNES
jgi:DNA repair ATPase RecN